MPISSDVTCLVLRVGEISDYRFGADNGCPIEVVYCWNSTIYRLQVLAHLSRPFYH